MNRHEFEKRFGVVGFEFKNNQYRDRDTQNLWCGWQAELSASKEAAASEPVGWPYLQEIHADAAFLFHRVQQGSLTPDDAAKAVREKLEKVISSTVVPIYQNRAEGFNTAWRDVSKECYDECSKLNAFETRIVYTAPPATSGQKLTEDAVIAALPKECTKIYGDFERGYNKALGHAAEKLRALLRASSATASGKGE